MRSSPWLAWRSAAARKAIEASPGSAPDLRATARALAAHLGAVDRPETSFISEDAFPSEATPLDLSRVSDDTARLARAMFAVGGREAWSISEVEPLRRLAAMVGAPAVALAPRLSAALDEVSSLDERTRLAIRAGDPLKGRYGGVVESEGRRITLDGYRETGDPVVLALGIRVAGLHGGGSATGTVSFHLPSRYRPSIETVRVFEGTARYELYASDAFTLGVVASDGTRLELDLTAEESLPIWFREGKKRVEATVQSL